MKLVRVACNLLTIFLFMTILSSNVFASLTKEQAEDVAAFATNFIEKGNQRRDENGYPLLVYALSNNWKTSVEIRRSGYLGELYHIKTNNYHMKNGKYLDLGPKWCMDCGDFIAYVYNTTFGLDMYLHDIEDPWHIIDMYKDANKYDDSKYFEFIYKNVPISSIDESKLEPGDVVLRLGSRENHGLIYVGEEMQCAHASRNAIKYSKNPPILGFEVVQLNKFYKSSTIVSIARIKNGIVPTTQIANSTIIWPDTGEEEDLLGDKIERKTNSLQKGNFINEITLPITIKNFQLASSNITTEINENYNYMHDKIAEFLLNEIKKLIYQIRK